ncbi:MAG: DUF1844 domain-containing protein [Desulfobacterales bacterium]|jgi:hypothetical protein|nr:DUF1844 domain-containing protein [Desulfobacterales bacterium]
MAEEKDFILKDKEGNAARNSGDGAGAEKPFAGRKGDSPLPAIDFSTFIMSLNASALVNLGVIEDPVTGQKTKNLSIGKQTIDIIGMLEEKTRGNLTPDEGALIKGMLYDLRITFVKQSG